MKQECRLVMYAENRPHAMYTAREITELYQFLADMAGAGLYLL